ncbi:MAG TPA: hypothetical protein VF696_02215, partial [Candidatus Paceibacterota bacterium]
GQAVTLTLQTRNATSATVNGMAIPVNGSITVNPTGDTTYVATVTGARNSVNCQTSVRLEVPVTVTPECIALTASPRVITARGQAVTLTLQTRNATSATVNGMAIPVNGSITVNPTGDTTYVATVAGAPANSNCQTSVTFVPPTESRCIELTANRRSIDRGDEVVLSWRTQNASSVTINNGIGAVSPVREGSIRVRPTRDTTYQASIPGDESNPNCVVRIDVDDDRDRPDRDRRDRDRERPLAFLASVDRPAEPPLASVYLSEIPYTGLDLGPAGTAVYWLMLILWSLAAAYLVLFTLVPYMFRRGATAGAGNDTSGHLPGWGPSASVPTPAVVHQAAHAAVVASTLAPQRPAMTIPAPVAPVAPKASVHSPHAGFSSFGDKGSLTIDDIVKGLSRESGMVFTQPNEPEASPARVNVEPIRSAAPEQANEIHYADDVIDFLEGLLEGDRDRVFGMVRNISKQGGDSQHFVSQAVCALDDAYRARVEGTDCHPEVARVTSDCHTSFLERLVTSLATAVDSSYSAGMTNTKLALTRALAVVNG